MSLIIEEQIDKEPYYKKLTNDKVINITGEGGSGKSTLTNQLKEKEEYIVVDYDLIVGNPIENSIEYELKQMLLSKYGNAIFEPLKNRDIEIIKNNFTIMYNEIINYLLPQNKTIVLDGTQLRFINDYEQIKGIFICLRPSIDTCVKRSVQRYKEKNPDASVEQIEEYEIKRRKILEMLNPLMNDLILGVDKVNKQIEIDENFFLEFVNRDGYDIKEKITEEMKELKQRKEQNNLSNEDFYKKEMRDYANKIATLILQDYEEVLNEEDKEKIQGFINGDNSIVFLPEIDFPSNKVDGSKLPAIARKVEGKVYFPEYDNKKEIIEFVRKQKQLLIHEMFHIVTSNHYQKADYYIEEKGPFPYKRGSIFEEGLVEKSARDFAIKHKLLYHPCVNYIPYVVNIENFMKKYGIKDNSQMFNIPYDEILKCATEEEQKQYEYYEKTDFYKKMGYDIEKMSFEQRLEFENKITLTEQVTKIR